MFYSFMSERDGTEFEDLYYKYKNLVYHIALGILKDSFYAEDAASETFFNLAKSFNRIKTLESKQLGWYVAAAAKNTSLNLLEKRSKTDKNIEYDSITEAVAAEEKGYSVVIDKLVYTDLLKVIDNLPQQQKSIFLYKYYYELSVKEIASLMGLKENTVTVNLYRAKKKLSGWLKEADNSET